MSAPVVVTLPVMPPASLSANQRSRGGWQGHAYDAADVLRSCTYWLTQHGPHVALTGRSLPVALTVEVTWPKGRRRYDVDALASLTKHHIDALVAAGILPNDGPNEVSRISYSQRRQDGAHDPGVRITITSEANP